MNNILAVNGDFKDNRRFKKIMRNTVDIIFLRGLQIETIIGIYDWERKTKQMIVLDLDMATDIREAAKTDAIEHTVDYKAVSKRLISFIERSEFLLVETLAENIAKIVIDEFDVPWVKLVLNKKGAIRGATDVGIVIERGQKSIDA